MIEKEVTSSQMKKVAYDESKQELFITFNNNKVYKYSNVSLCLFNEFISAESVGSFFIKRIKNNKDYPFELFA